MTNLLTKTFFCLVALSFLAGEVNAEIVFTITPSGSNAQVRIFGSGTVSSNGTTSPGSVLNFDNFGAGPVLTTGNLTTDFSGQNIVISGNDNSTGNPYTATFSTFRITDSPSINGDDFDLRDQTGTAFSFDVGDTYSVDSTFTLTGFAFSTFNPGSYTSSSNDSPKFGSVTLSVLAVPEPTTFAMFGITIAGLGFRRRK